jgi:uncharacterized protein (TIGR00297 family)
VPTANGLLLAAACAAAISGAAFRARALNASGAVAATAVGLAAFGFGGGGGAAALLAFFVTSTGLGRWRRGRKEAMRFEKGSTRDAGQVLANGGVAALCAVASAAGPPEMRSAFWLAFLASLAAANADTWGTEIGAAAGGTPYSLRDGKRVFPGTSGAVSVVGTLASLAGGGVIGLAALMRSPQGTPGSARTALLVTACGLLGALADSVAGATLQAQWRDGAAEGRWLERPVSRVGESGASHAASARANRPDRGLPGVNNDVVNLIGVGAAAAAGFLAGLITGR